MHDLRSIRLVCAPPRKSYDLRGGFSAPSPCRTNDTALQHLRSGGSPRRALPPRAPLRLCHITPLQLTHYKTATTPQAEACGGASAYPRLIPSEAGLAPSGSPAALSHNSAATDSLQNSDTPAGRSLRGCLSMTLQAQRSVFLNWDAGELRLGQITPTALPSSRQTAS